MFKSIPCGFCDKLNCNFIGMVYCDKLNNWLQLKDRENFDR